MESESDVQAGGTWIVIAAFGAWSANVPSGMIGVIASLDGVRDNVLSRSKWFVPAGEYRQVLKSDRQFVIDPGKHHRVADSVEFGIGAHLVLSSRELSERYPAKGSMPAELVEQLYALREEEIRRLASLPEVAATHLLGLDWGARAKVADLLFTRCSAQARYALLNDAHHFVRSSAVLAERALANRTDSPDSIEDRREEIAEVLKSAGFRMEYDPGAIPGEGHVLIQIESGEVVDEPDEAIARLAREWSDLTDEAEKDET